MSLSKLPCLVVLLLVSVLSSSVRAEEPPPIKVRPDKEPFEPYKHLLPTDKVIEQFQERVKRDPKDLASYTMLANLHIRRARETGDFGGYDQAESAIRRALALNKDDVSAQANLALVLCAQHKFAEGLRLARDIYKKNPGQNDLLSLIGDAQLELGDLDAAEKTYRELKKLEPRYSLSSRLARLAEIKGQPDTALKEMSHAAEEEIQTSITPQARGWFPFRLGEMYFHADQLDKAATHLEESLKLNPRYPQALAYLGKVRAGQTRYDEAIKLYVQAAGLYPDLSMLADLGDLYARSGKEFLAKLNYDKVDAVGRKQDVYARELALFYCDHDRNLPDALELAKKDLEVRKDVYTYDTLAWALCKNKHFKEAEEAMTEALKRGTKDAAMFYHAGMIYAGLGEKDKAREYLKRALERNPHFSLLQAEKARKALKDLE